MKVRQSILTLMDFLLRRKDLKQFLGDDYKLNNISLQSPLTNVCGQYCMMFLFLRYTENWEMDIIIERLERVRPSTERDKMVNLIVEKIFGQDLNVVNVYFMVKQISKAIGMKE